MFSGDLSITVSPTIVVRVAMATLNVANQGGLHRQDRLSSYQTLPLRNQLKKFMAGPSSTPLEVESADSPWQEGVSLLDK